MNPRERIVYSTPIWFIGLGIIIFIGLITSSTEANGIIRDIGMFASGLCACLIIFQIFINAIGRKRDEH